MDSDYDIVVTEDGDLQFVYADELAEVFEGEALRTMRASHVEPLRGGWIANMEPSGGSWLFVEGEAECHTDLQTLTPFRLRAEALAAEREWLRKERGL